MTKLPPDIDAALEDVANAAELLESRRTFAGFVGIASAIENLQHKLNVARGLVLPAAEKQMEIGTQPEVTT